MTERIEKLKRERVGSAETQIIGFRLPIPTAKAIKIEAARRQVPLNALLSEMWHLYRAHKRAG